MNPLLIKAYRALAVVAPYAIVKAGIEGVSPASSNTDPLIGTSNSMGAPTDGLVDVVQVGLGEVVCGGNVKFGDPLTSNADGAAITAEAEAGKAVRTIGFAMSDGVANDIIPYQVAPGIIASA